MDRILLLLILFSFPSYQFAQSCILQSGGSVTVDLANFKVDNITDNGSNCTLDYSVDYKVNNPDGCGVSLQSVVLSGTGSQTNFNINGDGSWHTTTGIVYNTDCSGTLELRVSGNWGYPCSFVGVNYPGVTCLTISYGILPVELTSFSVLEKNEQLNLTSIQRYSFSHKQPEHGINYYRLKQVDFNGNFEYSKIISKNFFKRKVDWLIYPNPTSNFITLKSLSTQNNSFQIFNNLGKLILEGSFVHEKEIDLSDSPRGIYFILVKNKLGSFSEKVVKN